VRPPPGLASAASGRKRRSLICPCWRDTDARIPPLVFFLQKWFRFRQYRVDRYG
jgi:hypothetical protein